MSKALVALGITFLLAFIWNHYARQADWPLVTWGEFLAGGVVVSGSVFAMERRNRREREQ